MYSGQCSLLWPYGCTDKCCEVIKDMTWNNIKLKDITVNSPKITGNLYGSVDNPMKHIIFENVIVNDAPNFPGKNVPYYCNEGVDTETLQFLGINNPIPQCPISANSLGECNAIAKNISDSPGFARIQSSFVELNEEYENSNISDDS